jgi:hypothetical protein
LLEALPPSLVESCLIAVGIVSLLAVVKLRQDLPGAALGRRRGAKVAQIELARKLTEASPPSTP